jgi:hypothetical protein
MYTYIDWWLRIYIDSILGLRVSACACILGQEGCAHGGEVMSAHVDLYGPLGVC